MSDTGDSPGRKRDSKFMFDDESLDYAEGEFCKDLMPQMAQVRWAQSLVRNTRHNWKLSSRRELESLLFELQIAGEIWKHGLSQVEYEPLTLDGTKVDFRLRQGEYSLLLEAVSSKVSDSQKAATIIHRVKPGIISYSAAISGDEVAGEMILAQERVGEKVVDHSGRPVKFPVPDSCSTHVIAVDMRCHSLGVGGDFYDYHQIAYGPNGIPAHVVVHLGRKPIVGLWQSPPLRAAQLIKDRVHFIAFCNRKSFDTGLFESKHVGICYNPHVFPTIEQAAERLARIPLFNGAVIIEAPKPRKP